MSQTECSSMAVPLQSTLTPDQIEFTNAFNARRVTLKAYASCKTLEELHIVRDGFYLELSHDLCPKEYSIVRIGIVTDETVAQAAGSSLLELFRVTVQAARKSEGWDTMISALFSKADFVGSDLNDIWMKLEKGRMEWLRAISSVHSLKEILKGALEKDNEHTIGDASDAKMIWIYSLALSIPSLESPTSQWQEVTKMNDGSKPLSEYNAELWDSRKPEWEPLDIGIQLAAERAGTTLEAAWAA